MLDRARTGGHQLIVFVSLQPKGFSKAALRARQRQYATALAQLRRVLPSEGWSVLVAENTLWPKRLDNDGEFSSLLTGWDFVSVPQNQGNKNKGVGEIDMLTFALENCETSGLSSISYLTGRHLVSNRYIFDKTENMKYDGLVSNPNFLYLDGEFHEVSRDSLYNDMFFSLRPHLMQDYADFFVSNRQRMLDEGIGSEQLLFSFIHERGLRCEWLDQLGLIRLERTQRWRFARSRWHIC